MKANRLILLIILFMGLNIKINAQQSTDEDYYQAIEGLFSIITGGTDWMGSLNEGFDINTLSKLAKESKPKLSNSQCKELATLYKEKKLKKDFLKLYVPIFRRKLITVEDIQKLLDEMRKPEYKVAQEHILMVEGHMLQILPQSLTTVNDTLTIVSVNCPESYKQKFQLYYETTDAESMISKSVKSLIGTLTSNMDMEGKAFLSLLMENNYTLTLNSFYGIVTEQDLQTLTEIESMPERKRVNHAVVEFLGSDFQRHAVSLLLSYNRWVEMMCAIRNWG